MNPIHKKQIINILDTLKSLGLKTVSGSNFDDEKEIILDNGHVNISVDYNVFVDTSAFTIFISRVAHNSNFTFDEFLDHIGINGFKKKCDESDFDYINRYLDMLIHHLKTDLEKVALGKEWKSIPRDYLGYK